MNVFKVGDEFVHVTEESPPAFRGVLFVGYKGRSPSTVTETVIPLSDITKFDRVDPSTLSPEWLTALRCPQPARRLQKPALYRSEQPRRVTETQDWRNEAEEFFAGLLRNPATCLLFLPFILPGVLLYLLVCFGFWVTGGSKKFLLSALALFLSRI